MRFLMSGRCANYLALEDFKKQQPHPVAYVPLYTCETVIDPFVKAGYELIFYDFTKDMIPVFDESVLDKIHLISICGYYGFSGYDREFLKKCEERGICIIEDTTHSIFSADGIYEGCTYVVGSMRKWLGVSCGGFAIKKTGSFTPLILPPHEVHLNMRRQGLAVKTDAFRHPDTDTLADLLPQLEAYMQKLQSNAADTKVNRIRQQVNIVSGASAGLLSNPGTTTAIASLKAFALASAIGPAVSWLT